MDGQEAQEVEEKAQDEGKDAKGEEEKDEKEEPTSPKPAPEDISTVSHAIPQPNLNSYYTFIEGVIFIPQNFVVPLFYQLEQERACTHHWMKIATTKGVPDIGMMEEKVTKMGRDLSDVRLRESMLKEHFRRP